MKQPPGFEDTTQPHHICRLNKAIYGLKQGPRAWHQKLASVLLKNGFIASTADSSLFILQQPIATIYLLVYVDDIIVISSSSRATDKLVEGLRVNFHIKDLGHLRYFLGIEVRQTNKGLYLCQQRYASDILTRANMQKSRPSPTPMSSTEKLSVTDGTPLSSAEAITYRSIVGGSSIPHINPTRPVFCSQPCVSVSSCANKYTLVCRKENPKVCPRDSISRSSHSEIHEKHVNRLF